MLAAARNLLGTIQRNYFSSASFSASVSFSAAGKTPASKVMELPGFNDNYVSGEGSDGNKTRVAAMTSWLLANRRRTMLLGMCLLG